jgi:hypothetical protein
MVLFGFSVTIGVSAAKHCHETMPVTTAPQPPRGEIEDPEEENILPHALSTRRTMLLVERNQFLSITPIYCICSNKLKVWL